MLTELMKNIKGGCDSGVVNKLFIAGVTPLSGNTSIAGHTLTTKKRSGRLEFGQEYYLGQ